MEPVEQGWTVRRLSCGAEIELRNNYSVEIVYSMKRRTTRGDGLVNYMVPVTIEFMALRCALWDQQICFL